jgi:enoyl-[acyl-carrier-protein] reductase (NADH)
VVLYARSCILHSELPLLYDSLTVYGKAEEDAKRPSVMKFNMQQQVSTPRQSAEELAEEEADDALIEEMNTAAGGSSHGGVHAVYDSDDDEQETGQFQETSEDHKEMHQVSSYAFLVVVTCGDLVNW